MDVTALLRDRGAAASFADANAPSFRGSSNPRQRHHGSPLAVACDLVAGVTGPSDAAGVLNTTGPAVGRGGSPADATGAGMSPRCGRIGSVQGSPGAGKPLYLGYATIGIHHVVVV